jgi:hypothetical protein
MSPQAKVAETVRRAKARLSEIATQEVSMVDSGANKKRYLIVKRDDDMSNNQPVKKEGLRLPTEAKTGIMDGLAQSLDKLTALATMVGEAETDDTAAVPPDLGLALKQCAELIGGLADQYAPAEVAPPEAAPPDAAAAPPPDAAAGKAADATDEEKKNAPVAKELPPPQKDPDMGTPQHEGDNMYPPQKKMVAAIEAVAAAHNFAMGEIVDCAKVGRKIAGGRYKKLAELHDSLGKLLNELSYDDAADAAKLNDPPKVAAKKAASKDEKTEKSANDGRLDELLALTKRNAVELADQKQKIAKMAREPAESRVRENEGNGAPTRVQWPTDMSADLAARRRSERKSS